MILSFRGSIFRFLETHFEVRGEYFRLPGDLRGFPERGRGSQEVNPHFKGAKVWIIVERE